MGTASKIGLAVLAMAVLSTPLIGCTPEYFPEAHGEGDSVQHNFLSQAVNPMPNQTTQAPDQNGRRAGDAFERYREDNVTKPVGINTSQVKSGGVGTSGGSGNPAGTQ